MATPPVDDTAEARRRRGDEAAVRGAICTVAALSAMESHGLLARDQPTHVLWGMLHRFFSYCQTVYPDDEQVQSASLSLKEDESDSGRLLVDSDLFFDFYVSLSLLEPFASGDSLLADYLTLLIRRTYTCWSQVSVMVTDGITLADLPSVDEFDELVRFLAPSDRLPELVSALQWVLDSDTHFGATSDGDIPSRRHMAVIEASQDAMRSRVTDLPQESRLDGLKRLLSNEFRLLSSVVRTSASIFANLDESRGFQAEEVALAEGVNVALLPKTRVLAAEHLSYIRNRRAGAATEREVAISHYAEACRMAHFAFNMDGTARYAKYVAQNLLELAALGDDPLRRRVAEVAWVDAYVMPYIGGLLTGGNAPFVELGWTSPVLAPHAGYAHIPPYSAQPDYLYSGAGAGRLQSIFPSFTPDLWAAAVLLVQHFKDFDEAAYRLQPDSRLALFAPAEDQDARFPMRNQHPVAWLYCLAEVLLVEHASRHPHAGLHPACSVDLSYRRWFNNEVQAAFRGAPTESLRRSAPRRFPHAAKYLIPSGIGLEAGTGVQASMWPNIAASWAV